MTAATVLLPLCIAIGVLGLVFAVLFWMRGRRGRGLQLLGIALLPTGLYLIGLLTMVWDAAVALGRWGSQLVFNPAVWTGVALVALAVGLWFAGGWLASRRKTRAAVERATGGASGRQVGSGTAGRGSTQVSAAGSAKPAAEAKKTAAGGKKGNPDPELDEIEALLKSRGIE